MNRVIKLTKKGDKPRYFTTLTGMIKIMNKELKKEFFIHSTIAKWKFPYSIGEYKVDKIEKNNIECPCCGEKFNHVIEK